MKDTRMVSVPTVPLSKMQESDQRSTLVLKRGFEVMNECVVNEEEVGMGAGNGFVTAAHVAKRMRVERGRGNLEEIDRMRKALNRIKGHGCGSCYVLKKEGYGGHEIKRCETLMELGGSFGRMLDWKKTIRYGKGHKGICWRCHVPTYEDELHGGWEGRDVECEWEDVVIPVCLSIWLDKETRRAGEEEFGVRWERLQDFTRWIVMMPRDGYRSKGMELVVWIVKRNEQSE